MESKQEKFKRLAEGRVNKAIDSVRSLSKLSNRAHYDFNEDDIKKIFTVLKREVDDAKTTFNTALVRAGKNKFDLGK